MLKGFEQRDVAGVSEDSGDKSVGDPSRQVCAGPGVAGDEESAGRGHHAQGREEFAWSRATTGDWLLSGGQPKRQK